MNMKHIRRIALVAMMLGLLTFGLSAMAEQGPAAPTTDRQMEMPDEGVQDHQLLPEDNCPDCPWQQDAQGESMEEEGFWYGDQSGLEEDLYGWGQEEDPYGWNQEEDLYGWNQEEDLYGWNQEEEPYQAEDDGQPYDDYCPDDWMNDDGAPWQQDDDQGLNPQEDALWQAYEQLDALRQAATTGERDQLMPLLDALEQSVDALASGSLY